MGELSEAVKNWIRILPFSMIAPVRRFSGDIAD
jgi:hypothetical protein